MQHRLKRERGFIIRDSGVIGVPSVFEGAAHINDDAALAAHLHRRPTCIGAVATQGTLAVRTSPGPMPGAPPASRLFPRHRPATNTPSAPCRARRPPWSQTPDICLTVQPYASQILTFRPFPIKPHEIFIGKG